MNKLQASKGTIFRTKQPQKQMDHIDLGKGKRRMLSNEELKQRKRDHVGRMRYTSSILRQRQSAGEDDQKKGDVKKFWNFEMIESLTLCDVQEFKKHP